MERRILILSCFTGEGHNSAAKAMHSAFDALEVPSRIMDPFPFRENTPSILFLPSITV